MSDFEIKVSAELDDQNIKDALKKDYPLHISTKEIDNITSKLQSAFDKTYDIKINTSNIQKQISSAINSGLKGVTIPVNSSGSSKKGIPVSEKYWENIFKNQFTDRHTKSNTQKQLSSYYKEQAKQAQQIANQQEQYRNQYWKDIFSNQFTDRHTKSNELTQLKTYYEQQAKQAQQVAKLRANVLNGNYDADLAKMNAKINIYGEQDSDSLKQAKAALEEFKASYKTIQDSIKGNKITLNDDELVKNINNVDNAAKKFSNTMAVVNTELGKPISSDKALASSNRMLTWLEENTKAADKYGASIKAVAEAQASVTNMGDYNKNVAEFNQLKTQATLEGLTGRSFGQEFKNMFNKFKDWFGVSQLVMAGVNQISQSVSELKDVDTILTEISKTSDMTSTQLKQLGNDAFEVASKYGKSATDYLSGVQEMARNGFTGQQLEDMSKLSVLTQAAGDVDTDVANSYLLATNSAYKYRGEVEKLNAVLDGMNMITNRNSVSMSDMAEAISKAASMAAEMNVKEDELSALIGVAQAGTQQGGSEVGTSLKSLFINLQNTNSDKIVNTLASVGISMTEIVNGAEKLRTPIEILKDLSEVFTQLDEDDPLRAEILTNIGQKYHANTLSVILSSWSEYEKMLNDYHEGAGSAYNEAMKSANNWEGSANRLKNTFTDIVGNAVDSDGVIFILNSLNSILEVINKITDSLGSLGTFGGIAGALLGLKGVGQLKKISMLCTNVLRGSRNRYCIG